jgi:hypothetical protein
MCIDCWPLTIDHLSRLLTVDRWLLTICLDCCSLTVDHMCRLLTVDRWPWVQFLTASSEQHIRLHFETHKLLLCRESEQGVTSNVPWMMSNVPWMMSNVPWMMSKECSKTTPGSGCEIISEGMRLHMKIQTHSPTFLPVPSTSPIDYYDGGTVRLNTEFYSWNKSFGLANPRLRYSCLQVVFCVNLGAFFKCFLQLGWRLTGVRSTLTEWCPMVPA